MADGRRRLKRRVQTGCGVWDGGVELATDASPAHPCSSGPCPSGVRASGRVGIQYLIASLPANAESVRPSP